MRRVSRISAGECAPHAPVEMLSAWIARLLGLLAGSPTPALVPVRVRRADYRPSAIRQSLR
jgi:hypothetical protein